MKCQGIIGRGEKVQPEKRTLGVEVLLKTSGVEMCLHFVLKRNYLILIGAIFLLDMFVV